MPLVQITLKQERSPAERKALGDAVQAALVSAIGVPADDRFQIFATRAEDLVYDPGYLGIARTDAFVVVQITLSTGRSVSQKKALFAAVAAGFAALGLRPEDVMITLLETGRENWSFGNGIAQYADAPPPHLAGLDDARAG